MKYNKLNEKEIDKLLANTGIIIEWNGSSIIAIRMPNPSDRSSHLKITKAEYGEKLEIYSARAKTVYKASVCFLNDDSLKAEKVFEDEEKRDEWIDSIKEKYDSVNDELQVEKKTESVVEDSVLSPEQLIERKVDQNSLEVPF